MKSALVLAALLFARTPASNAATRTLVLGAEDDAAPWSYADGRGYVNDLLRLAYRSQGWDLQLRVMPYARCKQLALSGQLAGCFTTSKEPDLKGRLLFPLHPVISPRHLLFVTSESKLIGCNPNRWSSVPVVSIVNGYEYADELESLVRESKLQSHRVKSESIALQMLALGRVDVAAITLDEVKRLDWVLNGTVLKAERFRILCDFGPVPGYVAFSPANPLGRQALSVFERGRDELAETGQIAVLQHQWTGLAIERARAK